MDIHMVIIFAFVKYNVFSIYNKFSYDHTYVYLDTLNKAKEKAALAEETSDLTSDYEPAKRNRKKKRHFGDDEDSSSPSNSSSEDEISPNLKLPEPPKKRGNLQFLKANCG